MAANTILQTRHLRVDDYRCTAGPHDALFTERHASITVADVRRGSFGYCSRGETFELVAGSVLVGQPGDEYLCSHDHHAGGDESLSFHLAPEPLEDIGGRREVWRTGCLPPLPESMVLGELAQAAAEKRSDVGLDELAQVGERTELFARFSTVAGSKGAADSVRDPRGFAIKFYTEDGNWDLAGNNTPVVFIRDPLEFPDFIHSQKVDPFTNQQEPENVWDFFSHSPEATHQFTWLFGDRGIPASHRHMDGFGSHTFQWVNAAGERTWVKFHFKTDHGIACLSAEVSARRATERPQHHQINLLEAIERGDAPSWTLKLQVMPEADAAGYRFNPFDLTKVWPHADYPLIEVGRMVLNRNPDNYFAEVEQAAFDPGHFVPGIGPSPDKMLQGRLFAYGDAHRYRLGINHTRIPVNAPKGVPGGATNYGRDGAMRMDRNGGRSKNYEPNSFDGPRQTDEPLYAGLEAGGLSGATAPLVHAEDDDFVQAGNLYRLMAPDEQERLVEAIARSLSQVRRADIVARSIGYFREADAGYGARVEAAVQTRSASAAISS